MLSETWGLAAPRTGGPPPSLVGSEPKTGMAAAPTGWFVIQGEGALIERLREPLHRALSGRAAFYRVTVDWVGRGGGVMVSITGKKGRLPLIFDQQELEPGYVLRVVRDTVEKYGF